MCTCVCVYSNTVVVMTCVMMSQAVVINGEHLKLFHSLLLLRSERGLWEGGKEGGKEGRREGGREGGNKGRTRKDRQGEKEIGGRQEMRKEIEYCIMYASYVAGHTRSHHHKIT